MVTPEGEELLARALREMMPRIQFPLYGAPTSSVCVTSSYLQLSARDHNAIPDTQTGSLQRVVQKAAVGLIIYQSIIY